MQVRQGHWHTTTLIAALGIDGIVFSTTVNVDVFDASVEQVLVPELRPGDTLAMDNLSSHRQVSTIRAAQAIGAEVEFLPSYSPDLKPDREFVQQEQEPPTSFGLPDSGTALGEDTIAIDEVLQTDTANCSRQCGYATNELGTL